MDLNKVKLVSKDNCMKLFIDGVKVHGLQRLNFHREAGETKTSLTLCFKCDLTTENFKPDDLPEQIRDYRLKKTDP